MLAATLGVPAVASAHSSARLDQKERAIIRGINHERAAHGLAPVRASARLSRAADYHSWEMLDANYFAHTSRDGGSFDERVRRYVNKRALGETLAYIGGGCGRGSARQVVRMWMNSPPHRAILLSGTYRRVGIGKRVGSLGSSKACMVTADFSSKK
ncbi:MAG TPA: CAP domain-containing protein [Solirubrobacteraceae bacterium]|nr:CAP domain-containing protein [Solirubrobacteraceae bacterium]